MPKPPINPETVRKTLTWPVDLTEGSVVMRRCDLMTEVLTSHLPADAVRRSLIIERLSMEQFEAIRQGVDPNKLLAEQINALEPHERADVIQTLREYACVAIVSPKLVMVDEGKPGTVPVSIFPTMDLITIWGAVPPKNVAVDVAAPLPVPETAAQAERFPEEVEIGDAVPEPVESESGGSIPPLENVRVQTIESADGRVVEFAGC